MQYMTRNEALRKNLVRYRTEKPCKRGHNCERYTNTGSCVMCIIFYTRKYAIARNKMRAGLIHIEAWLPYEAATQVEKLIKRLEIIHGLTS